jgi:hypothetical protein
MYDIVMESKQILTDKTAVHYAHQARGEYYNGVSYKDAAELRTDFTLGIQGSISSSKNVKTPLIDMFLKPYRIVGE